MSIHDPSTDQVERDRNGALPARTFIKDLSIGDCVDGVFLVVDAEWSNGGGGSLFLRVADKSGVITVRQWDQKREIDCSDWRFVRIVGGVIEYKDRPQIRAAMVQKVDAPADLSDFEQVASMSPEALSLWLAELIDLIYNPWLTELVRGLTQGQFDGWPAALGHHHAVRNGLLQHSCEVAQIAYNICTSPRGEPFADTSLCIAGALVHDIGKIGETERQPGPIATYEFGSAGQVGHVGLGLLMVDRAIAKIDGFPADLRDALEGIVISHHGLKEHGAPVEPATREAVIVHHADKLSADMDIMRRDFEAVGTGWVYSRSMRRHIYAGAMGGNDDPNYGPGALEAAEATDTSLFQSLEATHAA